MGVVCEGHAGATQVVLFDFDTSADSWRIFNELNVSVA